jgi:hypothetical protein
LRVELIYGTTFIAMSVTLARFAGDGGAWTLLWWPAFAFLLVSIAYFTGSPCVFGKRADGTRHWFLTSILGPYLIIVHGVWTLQVLMSREVACHMVDDGLIVSRRLRIHESPQNVSIYCDLTAEFCDPVAIRRSATYRCFPILDGSAPSSDDLVNFVQQLRVEGNGRILIHCANGHGRTGLVAAAWLIANRTVESVDDAIALLREARPGIRLNGSQHTILEQAITGLRNTSRSATSGP